jgi:hypothetical protein
MRKLHRHKANTAAVLLAVYVFGAESDNGLICHNINRNSYYRSETRKLGYKDENGTWHGLVDELVKRRAEVGINLLAITNERKEAIDFLPPILNDK